MAKLTEAIFEILCDYSERRCTIAQARARLKDLGFDDEQIEDILDEGDSDSLDL